MYRSDLELSCNSCKHLDGMRSMRRESLVNYVNVDLKSVLQLFPMHVIHRM